MVNMCLAVNKLNLMHASIHKLYSLDVSHLTPHSSPPPVDCTYVAVLGEDKRVSCPQAPPTCSNSSDTILWCLAAAPSSVTTLAWEVCVSTEGVELVIGDPPILEGVSVDGEGRLVISGDVLGTQLNGGTVNCSWRDLTSSDTCSEGKTESFVVLGEWLPW